jgi:hypothetical protein
MGGSFSERIPIALAGVLVPAIALAQPAVPSFDQLQHVLRVGQTVVIEGTDGETRKGLVAALSPDSITVDVEATRDGPGFRRELAASAVNRVSRRDSIEQGLLIGVAAGMGATWGLVRYHCGPPGYDRECAANVIAVLAAGLVPAGAVIGVVVDWLIGRSPVYLAPATKTPATVSLSPWAVEKGGGLTISLGF